MNPVAHRGRRLLKRPDTALNRALSAAGWSVADLARHGALPHPVAHGYVMGKRRLPAATRERLQDALARDAGVFYDVLADDAPSPRRIQQGLETHPHNLRFLDAGECPALRVDGVVNHEEEGARFARAALVRLVEALPARERLIAKSCCKEGAYQGEVALRLGITRSRVGQLREQIIGALRWALARMEESCDRPEDVDAPALVKSALTREKNRLSLERLRANAAALAAGWAAYLQPVPTAQNATLSA